MGKRLSLAAFLVLNVVAVTAHASNELCGLIFEPDAPRSRQAAAAPTDTGVPTANLPAAAPSRPSLAALAPERTCEFPPQYQTAANATF